MFLPRRTKSRILWLAVVLLWLGLLAVLWGYNEPALSRASIAPGSEYAIPTAADRRLGVIGYATLEYEDPNAIVVGLPSDWTLAWHGPALGITILASIIAIPLLLAGRHGVLMLWAPRGFCEHCGYNLRGITSDRCPECGTPVTSAQPVTDP